MISCERLLDGVVYIVVGRTVGGILRTWSFKDLAPQALCFCERMDGNTPKANVSISVLRDLLDTKLLHLLVTFEIRYDSREHPINSGLLSLR